MAYRKLLTESRSVQEASPELLDMLNRALGLELASVIQYRAHKEMVCGLSSSAISEMLEDIAEEEQEHADLLTERVFYLGAMPNVVPTKVVLSENTKSMITANVEAEKEAILLYKQIIRQCLREGDDATRWTVEEILHDEEQHHDKFTTLLD
jgi:bacterioferritin